MYNYTFFLYINVQLLPILVQLSAFLPKKYPINVHLLQFLYNYTLFLPKKYPINVQECTITNNRMRLHFNQKPPCLVCKLYYLCSVNQNYISI